MTCSLWSLRRCSACKRPQRWCANAASVRIFPARLCPIRRSARDCYISVRVQGLSMDSRDGSDFQGAYHDFSAGDDDSARQEQEMQQIKRARHKSGVPPRGAGHANARWARDPGSSSDDYSYDDVGGHDQHYGDETDDFNNGETRQWSSQAAGGRGNHNNSGGSSQSRSYQPSSGAADVESWPQERQDSTSRVPLAPSYRQYSVTSPQSNGSNKTWRQDGLQAGQQYGMRSKYSTANGSGTQHPTQRRYASSGSGNGGEFEPRYYRSAAGRPPYVEEEDQRDVPPQLQLQLQWDKHLRQEQQRRGELHRRGGGASVARQGPRIFPKLQTGWFCKPEYTVQTLHDDIVKRCDQGSCGEGPLYMILKLCSTPAEMRVALDAIAAVRMAQVKCDKLEPFGERLCSVFVQACDACDACDVLCQALERSVDLGLPISQKRLQAVLMRWGSALEIDKLQKVFSAMPRGGIEPSTKTIYILVRAAVNLGRQAYAEDVAAAAAARGVRLHNATLELLKAGKSRQEAAQSNSSMLQS